MQNKVVQISLWETYTKVSEAEASNVPEFLRLLDEYLDWDEIIPEQFRHAYYSYTGRPHTYSLESMLAILTLQRIIGVEIDKAFLKVLACSAELRKFCGIHSVPDAAQITRFKQTYREFLKQVFQRLVDLTAPLCAEMDAAKAQTLIFDTTGIEARVFENNPKFFNGKLSQAKSFAKKNPGYNPYSGVYALLPDHAEHNPEIRQQYINGHFCYALKAGILTDGLGIVRHIEFFDDEFKKSCPETVEKKSDDPDSDKETGDSTALIPVLDSFRLLHPQLKFNTFLGDSAFDSYDNYDLLLNALGFDRAVIPINRRNSKPNVSSGFNEVGCPVCPRDGTPFIFAGECRGKHRSRRLKYVCPKSAKKGTSRVCTCENPCTDSPYGRCVYVYPHKNLRLHPGIERGSAEWNDLYKCRTAVERDIEILKDVLGVSGRMTFNSDTLKADLFIAAIVQLIGVLISGKIAKPELCLSVRKLFAV
jgi:transposase